MVKTHLAQEAKLVELLSRYKWQTITRTLEWLVWAERTHLCHNCWHKRKGHILPLAFLSLLLKILQKGCRYLRKKNQLYFTTFVMEYSYSHKEPQGSWCLTGKNDEKCFGNQRRLKRQQMISITFNHLPWLTMGELRAINMCKEC